jgi:hypothetical protein
MRDAGGLIGFFLIGPGGISVHTTPKKKRKKNNSAKQAKKRRATRL